jgi:hypothetical protein
MTAALAAAPVLTLATMEALAAVGPVAVGATGLIGAAGLAGARTVRRTRPVNHARRAGRAARRASGGHAGIARSARRRAGAARNTLASGSVGVGSRRATRATSGGAQPRAGAATMAGTRRAHRGGHSRNPLAGRHAKTSATATAPRRAGRGRVAGLTAGRRRAQGAANTSTATNKTARRTAAQAARRARGRTYRRVWDRSTRWRRAHRARAGQHIAGGGRIRRTWRLLSRAVALLSLLVTYVAAAVAVGTTAWVRLAHRTGNRVRAFRLASLAFLAVPFEGLGPDLRRLFALLRGAFASAAAVVPAVIPVAPEHEVGEPAMSDLSGVTTNLRPLIDAIRESTPLGGGEAPHAIEVAKWHDDLAELMDALAARLRADADIAAETLPAESGAHEITASLGSSASSFAVEIEEASAAWRAVNGTRFERLTSDDARERQWDHSTRPDA